MLLIQSKKTDCDTKITDIENEHDKYIATPEFNNIAAGVFDARLK